MPCSAVKILWSFLQFGGRMSVNIMNILLRDLVRQAVEFTNEHEYWGICEEEILQLLDTVDEENRHLANPLNKDSNVASFRPRQTPLTGEEEVYGKYLTMNYCGHDRSLLLKAFGSIEEMERHILSGGGILNCWTTYVFAFIDDQLRDYEVVATNEEGLTYLCNNHKEQTDGGGLHLSNIVKAELRWRQC